jgi:hypothetical protein
MIDRSRKLERGTRHYYASGLQGYGAHQEIVIEVIRRHNGELHQDEFDKEFRRRKFPLSSGDPRSFILCGRPYPWGHWLEITQCMVMAGILEQKGKRGRIRYSLPKGKRSSATD